MKTQNKKWGQERKYDVKTEKCVKKFTVYVFIVQSIFFSGPFEMRKITNLSLMAAKSPTEVWILSEVVKFTYQLLSHIVSKQIIQIRRISFEKGTPIPIGCNLEGY